MICMACMPPRKLGIHYSPGMLTILRWVDGDRRFAETGWLIAKPPTFLTEDEQKWCLERDWIRR